MGTRADFYVGRGEKAEWLGSIAWDGHPDSIPPKVRKANAEETFRKSVAAFLAKRDDATTPDMGWPWPWEDSTTTDYAYAFDGEKVWGCAFGYQWFEADKPEPEFERETKEALFPNMKFMAKVTLGPRSGVLLFAAPTPSKTKEKP